MYAKETLNHGELSALIRIKNQVSHELHCEKRLLNVLGVLNSLINSSIEHGKQSEDLPGDAVFGDLLIKPKLFSLREIFSDTK